MLILTLNRSIQLAPVMLGNIPHRKQGGGVDAQNELRLTHSIIEFILTQLHPIKKKKK